jgi:hypothetical protein
LPSERPRCREPDPTRGPSDHDDPGHGVSSTLTAPSCFFWNIS